MKPTVGRVVHFTEDLGGGLLEARMAWIIEIYDDSAVRLRVIVPSSADDCELGIAGAGDFEGDYSFSEEPKAECWSWPPKV